MNARSVDHQTSTAAALSPRQLVRENRLYAGTDGVSAEAGHHGCVPGFLDTASGQTYRSRFATGLPAPMHLLDGLPDDLIEARSANGRAIKVRASVVSGFLSGGCFLTREEAKQRLAQTPAPLA